MLQLTINPSKSLFEVIDVKRKRDEFIILDPRIFKPGPRPRLSLLKLILRIIYG